MTLFHTVSKADWKINSSSVTMFKDLKKND